MAVRTGTVFRRCSRDIVPSSNPIKNPTQRVYSSNFVLPPPLSPRSRKPGILEHDQRSAIGIPFMVSPMVGADNCTIYPRTVSHKSDAYSQSGRGDYTSRMAVISFLRSARRVIGLTAARAGEGDNRRVEPNGRAAAETADPAGGSLARNERSALQSLESAFRVEYVSPRNSVGRGSRTYRRVRRHVTPLDRARTSYQPPVGPRACLDSRVCLAGNDEA